MKYKAIIVFSIALALSGFAHAVPARPVWVNLTQPGGGVLEVRLYGDEGMHWLETRSGYSIVWDDMGVLSYAVEKDGILKSSGVVASQGDAEIQAIPKHLKPEKRAEKKLDTPKLTYRTHSAVNGSHPILVILIDYSTSARLNASVYTSGYYENMMFNQSNPGSLSSYYTENSYSVFTPSGVVAGSSWYASDYTVSHWAEDTNFAGMQIDDKNDCIQNLAREAMIKADSDVDYSIYDDNSDNVLSADELTVVVVHAGCGEEEMSCPGWDPDTTIWSHKSVIFGSGWSGCATVLGCTTYVTGDLCQGLTLDGVRLGYSPGDSDPLSYNMLAENSAVGVFAHEYGHSFGLPDLYDCDYSSEGIGNWGLMAGGAWNGPSSDGSSPSHFTAWSKYFLEWLTPTVVTSELLDEAVDEVENSPDVYQIMIPLTDTPVNPSAGGEKEYFLVENRQKTGFDTYLPGEGIMIWHVDDDQATINSNSFNDDENDKGVDVEAADGRTDLDSSANRGDATDPWYDGNTAPLYGGVFMDNSTPNSKRKSGASTYINLSDIPASGSTMYADFLGFGSLLPNVTLGYLTVDLVTPNSSFNISSDGSFNVSVTVSCLGGWCGNVSVTLDPEELYYDDGESDQSIYWPAPATGKGLAVRFTTSKDAVNNISFYLTQFPQNFTWKILNGTASSVGNTTSEGNTSTNQTGWHNISVGNVSVTNNFYVGLFYLSDNGRPTLGGDTDAPTDNRSLNYNGSEYATSYTYDYMIRAFVSQLGTTTSSTTSTTTSTTSTTTTLPHKTVIPQGSGTPFFTPDTNPINHSTLPCLLNMTENTTCNITWRVGVNVSSGTYEFFVYVNGSVSGNESGRFNVTVLPIISGQLIPYLISPNTSSDVSLNQSFNFTVGVRCVGGSCGNVTATLDPHEITSETELSFDDGTAEAGVSMPSTHQSHYVVFNTTKDRVQRLKYFIHSSPHLFSWGVYNGTLSSIGNLISSDNTIPSSTGWHEVNVSNTPISQVFWVGMTWVDNSNTPKLGADQTPPLDSRTWTWDGTSLTQVSSYDAMIRAVVGTSTTTTTSSSTSTSSTSSTTAPATTSTMPLKDVVPVGSGQPFYTLDANPMGPANLSCLMNLTENESCNITWRVVPTGNVNTTHEFYVAFSNGFTQNSTPAVYLTILETLEPIISDPTPPNQTALRHYTPYVTLNISTNRQSICRLSNGSGVAYSNMTESFTVTNSTRHTTNISTAENNKTFTVYIRCLSSQGYTNSGDYILKYSTGSPRLFINEFLPNPATGYEWIELYNNGTDAINLTGFVVAHSEAGGAQNYTLNGSIDSGGFYLLNESESNITLADAGDTILLTDIYGVLLDNASYADGQAFGNITYNQTTESSIGRASDGSENWTVFNESQISPGTENGGFHETSIPVGAGWNLISLPVIV